MASQIYQSWGAKITAQASAAITADTDSGGAQTVVDATYDGGSENARGANAVDVWCNVTAAPSSAAGVELWASESLDGTNFAEAQLSLRADVPASTGYVFVGRHYIQAPYTKLKVRAIDYGFTAVVECLPLTVEAQ